MNIKVFLKTNDKPFECDCIGVTSHYEYDKDCAYEWIQFIYLTTDKDGKAKMNVYLQLDECISGVEYYYNDDCLCPILNECLAAHLERILGFNRAKQYSQGSPTLFD